MSYNVKVRHTSDTGEGISVEARINGESVAHTFPKDMGFFEEHENGKPRFVEKLEEKYERKLKREGKTPSTALSQEEKKIHASKFENKEYGENSENFKPVKNPDNTMTVDLEDPEQIREYLKENMAEGYLSNEEGLNIDRFVDRYADLIESSQNFQEILEQIQTGRVQ